jgi:Cft2 family RNA processing exonuclease
LYSVNHILGSCQTLLVNGDGDRIVYTGDFCFPDTPVLQADVLVMEATYGTPEAVRSRDHGSLIDELVSIVKEGIAGQKPICIFAHPGKIQNLMNKLSTANVNVPFLAQKKDVQWADVYKRHGLNVGALCDIRTQEAFVILKSKEPYVIFYRFGTKVSDLEKYVTVRVSGFRAKQASYQVTKDYYVIALSDHADFKGLIEYAEKSEAQLVITDKSRCEMAGVLAEQIRKKLGIEALALPA